jgi:hypothetical protein
MIADYLERLERELCFDRSLSRCVRQEVEDHLWEAVAADPTGNTLQAQRRVIANFGDPGAIAAQFAIVSLARQSRRAGVVAVLAVASVFIAMKARLAWYAAAQWALTDDVRAVGGLVSLVDRYAFLLSVVIGLGGWLYIRSRQIPIAFDPAYQPLLSVMQCDGGSTCCFGDQRWGAYGAPVAWNGNVRGIHGSDRLNDA